MRVCLGNLFLESIAFQTAIASKRVCNNANVRVEKVTFNIGAIPSGITSASTLSCSFGTRNFLKPYPSRQLARLVEILVICMSPPSHSNATTPAGKPPEGLREEFEPEDPLSCPAIERLPPPMAGQVGSSFLIVDVWVCFSVHRGGTQQGLKLSYDIIF
jgi:hypothetical protein